MQHNYRRDICAKMHLLQKIPRSRFQQHTKSEKKKTSKNKKKYYYNDVVVEVEINGGIPVQLRLSGTP